MRTNSILRLVAAVLLLTVFACKKNEAPLSMSGWSDDIAGFFLLNEGNKGSNKCTLDYYDDSAGIYRKNVFPESNPGFFQEMGDIGTDLQVYGSRLYAVVSGSGLVEVMDLESARLIDTVQIQDCRYIVFQDAYAYVSSYAGATEFDFDGPVGYVAKIDTASLKVVATCAVGYQPEEMVITNGKLYVANSGCYRMPEYDHTVSVIDLDSFQKIRTIDVAPNLHRMEIDAYGNIWVSSRGDYYDIPSTVHVVDSERECVVDVMDLLACSDMTICGDTLYVLGNNWSEFTQSSTISYALVNVKTHQILTRRLVTDGTDAQFQAPYGIAVNPLTREFYITDARDHITPGRIYCYSPEGRLRWQYNTGDIPSRIAFTNQRLR